MAYRLYYADCNCADRSIRRDFRIQNFRIDNEPAAADAFLRARAQEPYFAVHVQGRHIVHVRGTP